MTPSIGHAAADNPSEIPPGDICPNIRINILCRSILVNAVVPSNQHHARQITCSAHHIHRAKAFLYGRRTNAVQFHRGRSRIQRNSRRRSAVQTPACRPGRIDASASGELNHGFTARIINGVRIGGHPIQDKAVAQIDPQVIGLANQRIGSHNVHELFKAGKVNQTGSQRQILQNTAHIVHGGVHEATAGHSDIAGNRTRSVDQNTDGAAQCRFILEKHGAGGGGNGSAAAYAQHVHGLPGNAGIQTPPAKDSRNISCSGKHRAGINGIFPRKGYVTG